MQPRRKKRPAITDIVSEMQELAGRQPFRLAGEGQRYDPDTGKLMMQKHKHILVLLS